MKINPNEYIGKKYGSWIIKEYNGKQYVSCGGPQFSRIFLCECECGTIKNVSLNNLKSGRSKGCSECVKHGSKLKDPIYNSKHPLYRVWVSMKARCNKQNNYKDVGVCKRWETSFKNFVDDMGEKPSKEHSIDRIDPFGNYEPSNCRWATLEQQRSNMRISNKLTEINIEKITGYSRERIRQLRNQGDLDYYIKEKIGESFIYKEIIIDYLYLRRKSIKLGRPKLI